MNKPIRPRIFLWAAVILLMIIGGWWLVGRMSVGTYRNALNYQEATKDTLRRDIKTGCSHVNGGLIWIGKDSPKYVSDPMANSDKIYRYIVLDYTALSDSACLSTVVASARRNSLYPVSILFSNNGNEVANFYFSPGEK